MLCTPSKYNVRICLNLSLLANFSMPFAGMLLLQVCLIHKGGELSVVEYGTNEVAAVVPTELMSPYLLSVAVRSSRAGLGPSGAGAAEAVKRLAYLVDLKTIRVLDIVQRSLLAAISHESRVDWLVSLCISASTHACRSAPCPWIECRDGLVRLFHDRYHLDHRN